LHFLKTLTSSITHCILSNGGPLNRKVPVKRDRCLL